MRLIVGLGNYPSEYARTRHNFGFLAADFLSEKFGFSPWKKESKFFGQVSTGELAGEKTILLKPETFMNLSGKSVSAVATFYKIPFEEIIVFSDDVDIPFGEVRLREKGGSGGHNGLKSIIALLRTENFSRLKFGIRTDLFEKIPTEDFVLQKFSAEEWGKIPSILSQGIQKISEKLKC